MTPEIKEILERPFAKEDISKDYDKFDYVKPHLVIGRLNQAFGQDGWQFVPEERIIDENWIVQYGKIGIKDESGEWVWKYNCGGKRRTIIKGTTVYKNVTNDYKSALSNCLKRCAMLLGIALHLYGDTEQSDEDSTDAPEQPPRRGQEQRRQPEQGKGTGSAEGGKGKPSGGGTKMAATLQREQAVLDTLKKTGHETDRKSLRTSLLGAGNTYIEDDGGWVAYKALLDDENTWSDAETGDLPEDLKAE